MSSDVGEVMERLENEPFRHFTYVTAYSTTLLLLHLRHSSFTNPSVAFTQVTANSPTLPSPSPTSSHFPTISLLHLRHSLFSNPYVASPTSLLILNPSVAFTYVTAHSPTLPSPSLTSQLILQPFRRFTYLTAHSLTVPLLHLRHSSFSNPFVASPTPQLILQPFRCFTYVTAHSPTLPSLHLRHLASRPYVAQWIYLFLYIFTMLYQNMSPIIV